MKANTYSVKYDKKTGGEGEIIVKALSQNDAIANAKFLCFTGANFRDAKEVNGDKYIKPRKQGYFGSHRANN